MDLRCASKLHGILYDNGILEIKCRSRFCGHEPGVVVIHKFNVHTGAVDTVRYKEPPLTQERSLDGASNNGPSVRSA